MIMMETDIKIKQDNMLLEEYIIEYINLSD